MEHIQRICPVFAMRLEKILNAHQHTRNHAHKMLGLCDEHIEEEQGCGPPVAQITTAACGW